MQKKSEVYFLKLIVMFDFPSLSLLSNFGLTIGWIWNVSKDTLKLLGNLLKNSSSNNKCINNELNN